MLLSPSQPPKKQYVNYKTLQQEVQDKKKAAQEEVQPVSFFGSSQGWPVPVDMSQHYIQFYLLCEKDGGPLGRS